MIRLRFLAFVVWLGLGWPAIAVSAEPAGDSGKTLHVFAAASLREAFTAIGKQFENENQVVVQFNFAGADMLANQIVQGAPADVFASANTAWAQFLEDKGELDSVPRVFARNRLIVIVPKANPATIRSPRDLGRPGVKLVLEAPTVPLGKYAREHSRR